MDTLLSWLWVIPVAAVANINRLGRWYGLSQGDSIRGVLTERDMKDYSLDEQRLRLLIYVLVCPGMAVLDKDFGADFETMTHHWRGRLDEYPQDAIRRMYDLGRVTDAEKKYLKQLPLNFMALVLRQVADYSIDQSQEFISRAQRLQQFIATRLEGYIADIAVHAYLIDNKPI